jgi:hypothetical protein
MDPMAWLESLAKRQGANPDELTTSANLDIPMPDADTKISGPGYTPYETGSSKPKPEAAKPVTPPPAPVTPPPPVAPAPVASDDPFGGMDPMAWLESLAKRQGANVDELTTAANLDIPTPDADTKVTGPGYTPGYDTGSKKTAEPAKPAPAPVKVAPPPPPAPVTPPPPVAAAPAPVASDDPFGGMDPMAWLESLAKRQGANLDELTTSADLDIPTPDADTKVTGPGYTPGYDTGSKKAAEPAKSAPEPIKVTPPPPPPPVAAAPAPTPAASDDPFGGMDPMAWLESLAKRQGANLDELTTAANLDIPTPDADTKVTGPGYTPGYDAGPKKTAEPVKPAPEPVKVAPPPPAPVTPPPPVAATPAPVASDDPFGGMDPMAWLESLAKRQGANLDELTTSADLDIPTPDADTKVTGPGYTPGYDAGPKKTAEPAKPELPKQPETIQLQRLAPLPTPPPKQPDTAKLPAYVPPPPEPVQPAASTDDPLNLGMDSMSWLEALAKRQGANLDELITGGTAEIPPAPSASNLPSGPGYTSYEPFGQPPLSGEFESPSVSMSQAEAERFLGLSALDDQPTPADPGTIGWMEGLSSDFSTSPSGMDDFDPLKWLEGLSASEPPAPPPSGEMRGFNAPTLEPSTLEAESAFDFLEQLTQETGESSLTGVEQAFEPESTRSEVDKGGLSDDPQELLKWLNQQTTGLAAVREIENETPSFDLSDSGELAPAQLPDWLKDQLGTQATPSNVLSEEMVQPDMPAGLPGWLAERIEGQSEAVDLESLISDVQPTPADFVPIALEDELLPKLSTREIEAMTSADPMDAPDPWAIAFEEEFERKQAGEVGIPDWYLEALTRNEAEPGLLPAVAEASKPEPVVAAPAVLEPSAIPDWLQDLQPAAELTPEPDPIPEPIPVAPVPDIPGWLLESSPNIPIAPSAVSSQAEAEAALEALFAQPQESFPVRPTQAVPLDPIPAVPPKAPPTRMVAPPPAPPVKPATPPQSSPAQIDLAGALRSARDLIGSGQAAESLSMLEPLVDANYELDTVASLLGSVQGAMPKAPRVKRLLGDVFMRQGKLQQALDTYRSALDQL